MLEQSIIPSSLACVGRSVTELSFKAPSGQAGKPSRGQVSVTNTLAGTVDLPDERGTAYDLRLRIEVIPEDGADYYNVAVEVSGRFLPNDSCEDPELEVLSYGSSSLYSYACGVVESLTHGGVFSELTLPPLSFRASRNDEEGPSD